MIELHSFIETFGVWTRFKEGKGVINCIPELSVSCYTRPKYLFVLIFGVYIR